MSCESLPMNAPSSIVVWCFCRAVVVAGDRAGADVDVRADRRVAEIREVHRLRPGAEHRLLQLDEVADRARSRDVGVGAQVRERADARVVRDASRR